MTHATTTEGLSDVWLFAFLGIYTAKASVQIDELKCMVAVVCYLETLLMECYQKVKNLSQEWYLNQRG